jgi:hypothetical protein
MNFAATGGKIQDMKITGYTLITIIFAMHIICIAKTVKKHKTCELKIHQTIKKASNKLEGLNRYERNLHN